MADGSRVKGCLKWGCLGCAGLLALGILVSLIVAGLVALQDSTVRVEEQALDQEIPPQAGLPAPPEDDIGDPMRDIVQGFRLDGVDAEAPGRVVLDLSIGDFEIVPGPADQPAHVEAVFDTNRYKLEQNWEQRDDGSWTYRVFFGSRGFLKMLLGQEGRPPKVKIVLPRDRPFTLDAHVRMGESDMELGGLWVLDADLKLGMGEHTVRFSDPLAAPMGRLFVDGSMGEVTVRNAGNASPAEIEASHGMGAMAIDLRGAWVRDATIDVRGSMGEVAVRVPDDVGLELLGASVTLGEAYTREMRDRPEPPPGAPTLKLKARGSMGELRVTR